MYAIKEFSDIFTDACVRDDGGHLLFASLYGRDGALLQLMAAFSLKRDEGGLNSFTIVDEHERPHSVYVYAPESLEKLSGRFPKANLFGNMSHVWLYDPRLTKRDYVNRTAWVIQQNAYSDPLEKIELVEKAWHIIRDLSPIPLLDHWKDVILHDLDINCVHHLSESRYPPIGPVNGFQVSLNDDFVTNISHAIKSRKLALS